MVQTLTVPMVLSKLKKLYPDATCTLDWKKPLDLLIATILAAQCTDARVNIVTKSLFKKYKTPQDYVSVPIEELEADIRSCGTYHMKALAIQETCRKIIDDHQGKVPTSMEEMLKLRGVGRKTAAIVLGEAFDIITGVPIDTHNIRLLQRLGLTKYSDQKRIELEMMEKTPQKDWLTLSHVMVAHGRAVCIARDRQCEICVFAADCPSSKVRGKPDLAKPKASRARPPR